MYNLVALLPLLFASSMPLAITLLPLPWKVHVAIVEKEKRRKRVHYTQIYQPQGGRKKKESKIKSKVQTN